MSTKYFPTCVHCYPEILFNLTNIDCKIAENEFVQIFFLNPMPVTDKSG